VRNNTLRNVKHGIRLNGDDSLVEHNSIVNIAEDGIIGGANNIVIQYNTLKNFYKVNSNHDDGIQFHRGHNPDRIPMENVVIRGNVIISHDPDINNPLVGSPMGINGTDPGMYVNWLVENNVVLVQAYVGLSVSGAIDSTIVNNISFDPTEQFYAWISMEGTGVNTIVRNNMSRQFFLGGENITASHNLDIDNYDPDELFVDYQNHDLRHNRTSPAVDAGTSESAPDKDIKGIPRPVGLGYDIGAYEILHSDINNNGFVDIKDFGQLALYWGDTACGLCDGADLTYDGNVNIDDLAEFLSYWLAGTK
jgi:hypothetical protein